ncbi:MAG: carboxylesterase family protein [Sphingomonas sp.]|uniref:carboxylesterase/lipase family protein n=1 Tax=Sphingomonas sp. TaxID=28214 RepID=UPI001AD0E40C|nr:carboxylesterase family protein [Sphingomonas sp.]MBN8814339.1 carboxylesterase family protein [Sphingomonas sp.]
MTDGAADLVVFAPAGAVRGTRKDGVSRFLGIPYGAPPVGDRRWRPPEPAAKWQDVRDATQFAPDAMQRNRPAGSRAPSVSEDCLTLNIWAPAAKAPPRAVMVWFYGGSFIHGSAADVRSDGTVFAREDVVFVSVTSRTGIFGWLAHPDLAAESPEGAAGNYGLLDAILALRWIKANIAAFGGDPDRVTVFGVSSGGASIALLMTSPLAVGAFDQVILQSAGSFRPLATLAQATDAGAALGSLADLRALPADQVLALEPRLVPAVRGLTTPRVLRPVIDGWVVPQDERAAYRAGAFAAVPAIVGSNADEGSRLTASWPVDDLAGWNATLDANFPADRDRAAALYPAARDDEARGAVAQMFGDSQFQLGTRELARALLARGVPVFRYLFTRRRAGTSDGPHHGGEVPYVFGHLDEPPAGNAPAAGERDVALARSFVVAWTNFAKTGQPGSIDGVDWPSAETGFLELGDQTCVGHAWRDAQLDFLNDYADR